MIGYVGATVTSVFPSTRPKINKQQYHEHPRKKYMVGSGGRGVEVDPEPVTEKSSKSASAMYLYIGACTNSLREFRERFVARKKRGRKKKNGTHSRARTYYANESVDSTSRLTRNEIPRDPEYPGVPCRCDVRQEGQTNSLVRHSRDL